MKSLKQIILDHYHQYPNMELDDYFKLIYQHINGGNHLLKDLNIAKKYLLDEYLSIESNNHQPLFEDIGNNLYRINIARFKYEQYNIDQLFDAFVISANEYHKNSNKMKKAFTILSNLIKEGQTPIDITLFNEYLSWYRKNDYPIISHSNKYKDLYNPHYRIINKKFLKPIQLY